jgi:hypothetical protein
MSLPLPMIDAFQSPVPLPDSSAFERELSIEKKNRSVSRTTTTTGTSGMVAPSSSGKRNRSFCPSTPMKSPSTATTRVYDSHPLLFTPHSAPSSSSMVPHITSGGGGNSNINGKSLLLNHLAICL